MTRLIKSAAKKSGLAPGSLVYTGSAKNLPAKLNVIRYSLEHVEEQSLTTLDEIVALNKYTGVTWIDIDGISDIQMLEKLGKHFHLHPLIVEDIVSVEQRPKLVEYDNCIYIVMQMITHDEKKSKISTEQLSIIVTGDTVLTFQDGPEDVLEPVRKRIRAAIGRIRKMGTDYLAYALIDAVVDHYFVVLEQIGGRIETLEDEVVKHQSALVVQDIHAMKREIIYLRRSVWPLRDAINGFREVASDLVSEDIDVFLHDLDDHILRIIDVLETYRDMLGTVLEIYMSSISLKMNAVMKVLTVISTIFIPLTFIVGLYGMNFTEQMPEFHWRWSYVAVWILMLGISGTMLVYFKKKDWM